jgi:hypothetical protein
VSWNPPQEIAQLFVSPKTHYSKEAGISVMTTLLKETISVADNHPSQLTAIQKRDWAAAHILYTSNIRASLAGCPAAAFYGSNTLWVQSMLLVNDPDFQDACRVLHANGYKDAPMDQRDHQMLQSPT